MDPATLKALAYARGMNQSALALAAGVTRQRVSQWFAQKSPTPINIQSKHLLALARALNIKTDELLHPLPLIGDAEAARRETTKLLWDGLYPDLVSFAADAANGRPQAVARLVEIYGLFETAHMLGKAVWTKFPKYKKYIPPVRRRELESLWDLRTGRTNA